MLKIVTTGEIGTEARRYANKIMFCISAGMQLIVLRCVIATRNRCPLQQAAEIALKGICAIILQAIW